MTKSTRHFWAWAFAFAVSVASVASADPFGDVELAAEEPALRGGVQGVALSLEDLRELFDLPHAGGDPTQCAKHLVSWRPTPTDFYAAGGMSLLPFLTHDLETAFAVVRWLRFHQFSWQAIAETLDQRSIRIPNRATLIGWWNARQLFRAGRAGALAAADQLATRTGGQAEIAIHLLDQAGLTPAEILVYLNVRRFPYEFLSPKKLKLVKEGKLKRKHWTVLRIVAVLASPERAGAIYDKRFEDEEAMFAVRAQADEIVVKAWEQWRATASKPEKDPSAPKMKKIFAMAPLKRTDQEALILTMNWLRHRAVKLRERLGPFIDEDDARLGQVNSWLEEANEYRTVVGLSNARLIIKFRFPFLDTVPVDDLDSEGLEVIMRAVDKLELSRGNALGTLVGTSMKNAFLRLQDRDKVQSRAGRANEVSLEDFRGDDDQAAMALADPDTVDPEDLGETALLSETVAEKFRFLPPRDREILERIFGLGNWYGQPQTLEVVGLHFKLTKERIRQIKVKALKKLRKLVMGKELTAAELAEADEEE